MVVSDFSVLPSCLLFSPGHEEQAGFKAKKPCLKVFSSMRKGHSKKPLGTSVSPPRGCESQSLSGWLSSGH